MEEHDYGALGAFGTIVLVVSVVGALAFGVLAVSHLNIAAEGRADVAGSNRAIAWTYLAYGAASVFGGMLFNAVMKWMIAMHDNLVALRREVKGLQYGGSKGLRYGEPKGALPLAANVRKQDPIAQVATDATKIACPNCEQVFAVSPGTTWHSCPTCRSPLRS